MRRRSSWIAVCSGLLATFGAAGGQELRPAPLSRGFALDGAVAEWQGTPPTLTIDAASQVAGKAKPTGSADISAKIWLTLGAEGLLVAGEVSDDKVLLPTGDGDVLASDHVELWLAMPPADVPPILFGNQFVRVALADPEDCAAAKDEEGQSVELDVEPCRAWVAAQTERRKQIDRLWVRQYGLSPRGVAEYWASGLPAVNEGLPGCCGAAKAVFQAMPGGYSFEASLPFDVWPATGATGLNDLRLLVDLVDNDDARKGQETFLSSAKARRFGDPASFNKLVLAAPLRFESEPAFLEATLHQRPQHFYFPARPVKSVWALRNISVGYQYQPENDSPELFELPLPGRRIAQFGDLEVWSAPADVSEDGGIPSTRLFTVRGGKVLDQLETENYCPDGSLEASAPPLAQLAIERAPDIDWLTRPAAAGEACHLLVLTCHGILSRYGSGTCGACPTLALEVDAIDPRSGKLKQVQMSTLGSLSGAFTFDLDTKPTATGFRVVAEDESLKTCRTASFRWADLLARCGAAAAPEPEGEFYSVDTDAPPDASPLFKAIYADDVEAVRAALAHGNRAAEQDAAGHPALLIAAFQASVDVVDLLLDRGADANAASRACGTEPGITPLMAAAARGDAEVVKRLLAAGARADAKIDDGRTAKDLAFDEAIKTLLPP